MVLSWLMPYFASARRPTRGSHGKAAVHYSSMKAASTP